MTKTDAWMPLWIGAYLADTMHLSRDEHGGYLLLIMTYWRTREPLPDSDKHLASIVKATPKEWKELRPVLSKFFKVENGTWTHKRIEQELASASDKKSKATSKAQAAAQARWKDAPSIPPSNAPSIPQALHKECPTPTPIKPTSQSNASARDPEKFQMRIGWKPSDHLSDLAKQAGVAIKPEKLGEFITHWLTQPMTQRTQAEWDKALLQSSKHDKLHMESGQARPARKPENFDQRDYGIGVAAL